MAEQHLEFLSFTGGCTGSSESIHVKMPYCWKSHVTAHLMEIEMAQQQVKTVDINLIGADYIRALAY